MSPETTSAFPGKRNLAVLWAVQVLTTIGFSFTFPFYPIFFQELGVEGVERAAFWSGASGWMMGVGMGTSSAGVRRIASASASVCVFGLNGMLPT